MFRNRKKERKKETNKKKQRNKRVNNEMMKMPEDVHEKKEGRRFLFLWRDNPVKKEEKDTRKERMRECNSE